MRWHKVYRCDRCGETKFAEPETDANSSSGDRWPSGWSEVTIQTGPAVRTIETSRSRVLCASCTRAVNALLRDAPARAQVHATTPDG